MDIDKNLTIILIIKDRAPFTFRWMAYVSYVQFPFKILIADGGKDPRVPEILENKSNFPNIDYTYLRYPYDQTYSEYYAKLADVLSKVETPFVAMADDDDFFIVDALRNAVTFMKKNPEYIACGGQSRSFSLVPDTNKTFGDDVIFGNRTCNTSITHESALQRTWEHFSKRQSTWYDVHPTKELKKYFEAVRDIDPQCIYLVEYMTKGMALATGKLKREPYLYLLRQENPLNSTDYSESKQRDTFDYLLMDSWSHDFIGYVDSVATIIAKNDSIDFAEAREQVKQGYKRFIAGPIIGTLSKKYGKSKAQKKPSLSTQINKGIQFLASKVNPDNPLKKIGGTLYWKYYRKTEKPMIESPENNQDLLTISQFLTTPPKSHYEFLANS